MKPVLTIAAVGALTLSLAACGSSGPKGGTAASTPKYVNGKTLTMVLSADPGSLDPDFTSLGVTYQVDQFLYDSLVNFDSKGNAEAGLAAKWTDSPTKATFTLRQGVTCSDGSALTASVVADNINFVADPANKSTRIGVFVPPGAKATADDTTGTVTVTMTTPTAFLARTVGGLQIVCGNGMKDRGSLKEGADGTGPYTLTNAAPGTQYELTKRAGYTWGPGNYDASKPGLPAKVVLKVVANESTAANLLLSNQVNMAQIVGPDKQRLEAKSLFSQKVLAPLGELWFNHKAGEPTSDETVRKALLQALDLKQLGQVVSGGSGTDPTGMVAFGMSPCSQNSVTGNLPSNDVAAAKSALDSAGWTAGSGGVRTKGGKKLAITFDYPTSFGTTMESGAELVQKAWQAIGAQVTIKGLTTAQIGQQILAAQGQWTSGIIPLGVPLPSQLVPFLSGPGAPNGSNFSDIQNSDYSADVQKAATASGTAGCPDWAAAEAALFQHADVAPFVNSAVPIFAQGATFELTQGSVAPTSIRMLG